MKLNILLSVGFLFFISKNICVENVNAYKYIDKRTIIISNNKKLAIRSMAPISVPVLIRYLSNDQIDRSFGKNGIAALPTKASILDLTLSYGPESGTMFIKDEISTDIIVVDKDCKINWNDTRPARHNSNLIKVCNLNAIASNRRGLRNRSGYQQPLSSPAESESVQIGPRNLDESIMLPQEDESVAQSPSQGERIEDNNV